MGARSARGAETRLRIMRAAADLFHKQGVRATSPDQIIEASGTGKGQFYHYFRSKEGLVHEVLHSHLEAISSGSAPINYEIKSWPDLEGWFLAQLELQEHFGMTRGCPFGTIGNEITENDELIRQDLNIIFEVVKHKLAAFFIQEKAKGRFSKSVNENELADFCIVTVQGAMLMGKIKRNSRPAAASVHEALAHLKRYVVSPKLSASAGRS